VIANSLPFKKYPPRLIPEMVYNIVFLLNIFPHNDRVHATISPRIDLAKHCRIAFGMYVQVHEEGDNLPQPMMSGALHYHQPGRNRVSFVF